MIPATAPAEILGMSPLWLATLLMIATYGVIISERLNRSIVALLGAMLMIMLGLLTQEQAVAGIDFNTIGLLVGMMIIVSITRKCGVFEYLAIWSAKLVRASPAGILAMLAVVTAVVSAFLDNVTTVLLVVPVTLIITEALKVNPYPFLFSQILASNIGGTATLIGDPPNILIGGQVGLSFNDFVYHLTPVIVVVLAVHIVSMHLIWGRKMLSSAELRARVMAFNERDAITDARLLKLAGAVLALVIVLFVLARPLGLDSGTIGMAGAALLMMLDNLGKSAEEQSESVVKVFNEVEWITIFFFIGLFIVIAGVEHAGLLRLLADQLLAATGGDFATTGFSILWASAVLSAIVDNIPFVATMIPLIKSMAPAFGGAEGLLPLWWCLSLGACLGGNGTLIGASANLTVAGIAERNGIPFRFGTYTRVAFPLMLVHVAICHVYLWWRYF
ncbi:ArsB/NhaD family transporter [Accumulibacter sp.]|uniref:sodium:proton antiporter n=1 Tax=Accumulibacter sp. TaxID=2053492 RepID=UPI0025DA34ED|nr:ArsB/NhaD family transporter [Accumulibacter sp.]MCM8596532.1 ArsB/NhaD family transporter [Accumulibacter sp.]MCM8626935.1 ArsB/NhaD family transporter [Accumulibacter sp.]MDS4050680.1 ArsB/NhaD family transporter [Accumulibacter sp.]